MYHLLQNLSWYIKWHLHTYSFKKLYCILQKYIRITISQENKLQKILKLCHFTKIRLINSVTYIMMECQIVGGCFSIGKELCLLEWYEIALYYISKSIFHTIWHSFTLLTTHISAYGANNAPYYLTLQWFGLIHIWCSLCRKNHHPVCKCHAVLSTLVWSHAESRLFKLLGPYAKKS